MATGFDEVVGHCCHADPALESHCHETLDPTDCNTDLLSDSSILNSVWSAVTGGPWWSVFKACEHSCDFCMEWAPLP